MPINFFLFLNIKELEKYIESQIKLTNLTIPKFENINHFFYKMELISFCEEIYYELLNINKNNIGSSLNDKIEIMINNTKYKILKRDTEILKKENNVNKSPTLPVSDKVGYKTTKSKKKTKIENSSKEILKELNDIEFLYNSFKLYFKKRKIELKLLQDIIKKMLKNFEVDYLK